MRIAQRLLAVSVIAAASTTAHAQQPPATQQRQPHTVHIDTASAEGHVLLRPVMADGSLGTPIFCVSPCDLNLWPAWYQVTVDEPGRAVWNDHIGISAVTRSVTVRPRTVAGEALGIAGVIVGSITATTGLLLGAMKTSLCEGGETRGSGDCDSKGITSTRTTVLWISGAAITVAGIILLLNNRSSVTVDGRPYWMNRALMSNPSRE